MVRTEISLFLKNVPGELGKLTTMLSDAGINIDAITIQDASAYVRELFKARGKSLKRIASPASYNSMSKDSSEFALIRFLPSDAMTNKTIDLLSTHEYIFDMMPVISLELDNRPGELAKMAMRCGQKGININYVYGSVAQPNQKCLFVFSPDNIEYATKVFLEDESD
ncbi:MAG: amino acid-binding protein [Desulfobacteraceae bacterium]|nr:amino acid-binding protein [Desulfobacteraceae bacterium]